MLVGIDFDNTLVRYDRVFHGAAAARGWIDASLPVRKQAIRDHLRAQPGGEARWIELQFEVYTDGLAHAELPDGARRVLDWCRSAGVGVAIVSHKPAYAVADRGRTRPLRPAAQAWLARHGIDAPAWFEDTRAAKAARIGALGCTHHIDDLPEVFADPAFPADVRSLLVSDDAGQGWDEILALLRDDHAAEACAAVLTGMAPVRTQRRNGGGNARLWRLSWADGRTAMLKHYCDDGRNRGGTEVAALRLCEQHGLDGIPRVLAADAQRRWAVLSELPGERPQPPYAVTDLDQLAAWAGRLWRLSRAGPEAAPAAEAFLAAGDPQRILERRRARFTAEAVADPRVLHLLRDQLDALLAAACRRLPAAVPVQDRILSPSDFGFHNSLRDATGRLRLLDFEFFGWDDPAKMVGDLLLHAGSDLSAAERRHLRAGLLADLPAEGLADRLAALLPALCVNWAMIVLNEFLAGDAARRRFADVRRDLDGQLAKAAAYLALGRELLAGKDLCDA